MTVYLGSAFSLNMLSLASPFQIKGKPIEVEEAKKLAQGASSAVGHANTAAVFADVLGLPVAFNRATVNLNPGDVLLVGQYQGPRLEEGATKLPDGAKIAWIKLTVELASPPAVPKQLILGPAPDVQIDFPLEAGHRRAP